MRSFRPADITSKLALLPNVELLEKRLSGGFGNRCKSEVPSKIEDEELLNILDEG